MVDKYDAHRANIQNWYDFIYQNRTNVGPNCSAKTLIFKNDGWMAPTDERQYILNLSEKYGPGEKRGQLEAKR